VFAVFGGVVISIMVAGGVLTAATCALNASANPGVVEEYHAIS